MIKLEFDCDRENDFKNCSMTYSHKKTTSIEILMLISNLIDLIEANDEKANDENILSALCKLRAKKNDKGDNEND